MTSLRITTIALLLCLMATTSGRAGQQQQDSKTINIGFFEAGSYPQHDLLRAAFRAQLDDMLEPGYSVVYSPSAFMSADWKRDRCREMADRLAAMTDVDLLVTLGPWVVEDLLEAGFSKPIIAMLRFDPITEGLVDSTMRPIADNLALRAGPGSLETDIRALMRLTPVKKLGLLHFPSNTESEVVLEKLSHLGETYGFEVVTSEGFDNSGTFAFFKALWFLDKEVDAAYVSPLWGLDATEMTAFFRETNRRQLPVFSSEGRFQVSRGALAAAGSEEMTGLARFHAFQAIRIMKGETPADLPVLFRESQILTFNESTARRCEIDIPRSLLLGGDIIAADPDDDTDRFGISFAIQNALALNPGYLAWQDRLDAAGKAAAQAFSHYLPQLYGTGSATYLDDNTVDNYRSTIRSSLYRAELTLWQQVFSLPAINDIRLAGRFEDREAAARDSAALHLERAVGIAYLNCLKADESMKTLREYRRMIDRVLEVTESREQMAQADTADVIRWQYERNRITRLIGESEANLTVARLLFNLLINRPGDTPFVLQSGFVSPERCIGEYLQLSPFFDTDNTAQRTLEFLSGEALTTNPALRARDRDVEIAKTRLSGNTARYFPTVGFHATLGFQNELEDNLPFFEEKSTTWQVGAGLRWSLFPGGDRIHERARLKLELSRTEYEGDQTRLMVLGRVQTATHRFAASLLNLPVVLESEREAGMYLGFLADDYGVGDGVFRGRPGAPANRRSMVEMLDALDRSLQARLQAIITRYEYQTSGLALLNEMGISLRDESASAGNVILRELTRMSGAHE